MPKKWNDIKHQGMTPEQIKAAKKRVSELKKFARDLTARFASFKPHLDVIVVSDGIVFGPATKARGEKKAKKEARGGHHGR